MLRSLGWTRWTVGAAVVALALLIARPVRSGETLPSYWTKDWNAAQARAKAENKPLLACYSAEWCGPCQAMIREVYPQESVKQSLSAFVPVYLDEKDYPKEIEKAGVDAFPTFVIYSAQGEEEHRFVGGRPAEMFIGVLDQHQSTQKEVSEIRKKIGETPNDPTLWKALAAVEIKRENSDGGEKALRKALELAPEDPETWKGLGDLHQLKDESDDAVKAYEKALFYDPKDKAGAADDLFFLRAMPETADDIKSSGEKLADFETRFPESDLKQKVLFFRGLIASELQQNDQAMKLFQEAVDRFPDGSLTPQIKNVMEQLKNAPPA